jgi:signal transduction histidine kinase
VNALKFTTNGFVHVVLSQHPLPARPGKLQNSQISLLVSLANICISIAFQKKSDRFQVRDSGVGISKTFQAKSLFKPFRQENELKSGVGLVRLTSHVKLGG